MRNQQSGITAFYVGKSFLSLTDISLFALLSRFLIGTREPMVEAIRSRSRDTRAQSIKTTTSRHLSFHA
jgi:hypothetical protein